MSERNDLKQVCEGISDDKLKAAYALNMCTVSVSQIIDYNDIYILEQEYEAILNNLNLEVIPKDDSLLKTLTEILNTITFFRIQQIKKNQLEKEYQRRIKNAIWSAVPNLSMVISGSPVAMAVALATQVGIGYMNYRREKNNAKFDKEKADVELQITAIEQLNALRRELFTSAWKLADKYEFPDYLRLTERQIQQYNSILLDSDEYRKYARLESIQNNFLAYPPFWYHFAHTALYIATKTDDISVKDVYIKKAKKHFEKFRKLNAFNLLREDQISSSADLEYIELLFLDEKPDYKKIRNIIDDAVKKSGNAYDVLQMCAMAYLRAGESDSAARLLKILVNENYNAVTNAKILSRLYVSKYINTSDPDDRLNIDAEYRILETRVKASKILYPFPHDEISVKDEKGLEDKFLFVQKSLLKNAYRGSINAFEKNKIIEFNAVLPSPVKLDEEHNVYYGYTIDAKERRMQDVKSVLSGKYAEDYIMRLKERGYRQGYVKILNSTVAEMEKLSCFKKLENHDKLIENIEKKLKCAKKDFVELQAKMDSGSFAYNDYKCLVNDYSYRYFTEVFFDKIKEGIIQIIDKADNLEEINDLESNLSIFCDTYGLPMPEDYIDLLSLKKTEFDTDKSEIYFKCELVGECEEDDDDNLIKLRDSMIKVINEDISEMISNPDNVYVYVKGDKQYGSYLDNDELRVDNGSVYSLKQKAIAIIDDRTKKDCDMILCDDGVRLVLNGFVRQCVPYKDIEYSSRGNKPELKVGYPDVYVNKNIRVEILNNIMKKLYELTQKQ